MLKIGERVVRPEDLEPFLSMPWCGVDMHWHARDLNQQSKDTVEHSLQLAYAAGLAAVGAMPNTSPALTSLDLCKAYLSLADQTGVPIQFFVHIGLTPDVEQVKRAVEATRKDPRIIGMKAYWGRSTGDLSITRQDQQQAVWETLAREGYDGVIVGHYEEESFLGDAHFDRKSPKTWSVLSRPEIAEISSFYTITHAADRVKFKGRIHVAHVSTVHVVDEICRINAPNSQHHFASLNGRISCGVTPHHWIFNRDVMDGPHGLEYKCNPALREELVRERLKAYLFDERIPIEESDHAPHSEEDKKEAASGIPGGSAWPYVVALMRLVGMPEDRLRRVTFDNALKLYNLQDRVEYNPLVPDLESLAELQEVYHFDPFKELKS